MNPLVHINYNLSYACTLNCAHCYSRERAGSGELDLSGKLAVCDNILRARVFSVNLGGGEPFACPDLLPVVERLSQGNVIVALTTSGWKADPALIDEVCARGLKRAYLSIDDADPEKHDAQRRQPGCFDACIAAGERLAGNGVGLICSTVLTSENFARIGELLELAQSIGCIGVELKRLRLAGNARELADLELSSAQVDELYARLPEWKAAHPQMPISCIYGARRVEGIDEGCPCGRTILAIMADGTIAPCVYNPQAIGNATQDDIAALWHGSELLAQMRESGACAATVLAERLDI